MCIRLSMSCDSTRHTTPPHPHTHYMWSIHYSYTYRQNTYSMQNIPNILVQSARQSLSHDKTRPCWTRLQGQLSTCAHAAALGTLVASANDKREREREGDAWTYVEYDMYVETRCLKSIVYRQYYWAVKIHPVDSTVREKSRLA